VCSTPARLEPPAGVAGACGQRRRVPCQGITHNVPLSIDTEASSISCFGITLGSFDLILGYDFLHGLGPILWDFARHCMTFTRGDHRVTWLGVSASADTEPAVRAAITPTARPLLDRLLDQFGSIFEEPRGLPPDRPYDHRIHLLPGTAPVAVRPYRYPHLQKDELERQCAEMLGQGIIRPSTSPFSSPVLLVRKADKSWRLCIDYCALNAVTSKDKFPILVVDELLDELHEARFFSKLDLRSGYHQVRMHSPDIPKTAFQTHEGHYEFLVMPFGLANAPATFQTLMNDVLCSYLRRFALVFFDDILINSSSWAEHLQHLAITLKAIRDHHLHLKLSKCSFGAALVAYLGHVISAVGVAMDADKVSAVESWPEPRSAQALRGFLGLAGYYRKFIREFGIIAASLTRLLRRDAFAWDDDAAMAFRSLKAALTTGPVLQMPDFDKPFTVDTDASGSRFGAVLHQGVGPLAFFSQPFAGCHLKLAAYERELIGVVQAVWQWRPYLWGRHFIIRTDHFSLKYLLDQRLSTVPQHQWVSKLFGFDFDVEYRPGRLNTIVDALSRKDTEATPVAPCAAAALSGPSFAFLDEIHRGGAAAFDVVLLQERLRAGELPAPWHEDSGLRAWHWP
jgi:hypothetical protein